MSSRPGWRLSQGVGHELLVVTGAQHLLQPGLGLTRRCHVNVKLILSTFLANLRAFCAMPGVSSEVVDVSEPLNRLPKFPFLLRHN